MRSVINGGDVVLVKDVIISACKLIGLNDLCVYLNGESDVLQDESELSDMVVAVNMASNNIATNYIELKDSISIDMDREYILLNDLTDRVILSIKSVKRNGVNTWFKVCHDRLRVPKGKLEVEYTYFPDNVSLDDSIDYYSRINPMLFAQAVVAEYLFIKGEIDDAYMWDKRFKYNILNILRPRRIVGLPARRWY